MTMMAKVFAFALALSFCFVSTVFGAEVAVLTDANFEHDTQATSGGTTGSWLVLFYDKDNSEVKSVLETPRALETPLKVSEEEEEAPEPEKTKLVDDLLEEGIVAGIMDISENPKTAERMKISGTPHGILLHKGKLYRTNSMDGLKDFAVSEFELSPAEEIPSEPSLVTGSNNLQKIGVLAVVVGVLIAYVAKTYLTGSTPQDTKKKN